MHVQADDIVEFFRRRLGTRLADRARAAGDVDENVDAAIGALGRLRGLLAVQRIGDVARNDEGLASRGPRLCCDRFDRGGVAADQSQPRSLSRKGDRDGGAHPLGGAGNHRDAAPEHQVHARITPWTIPPIIVADACFGP